MTTSNETSENLPPNPILLPANISFLTELSKEESYCNHIAQAKTLSLIDLTQALSLLSNLNEKYQTVEYDFLDELSVQEKQQFGVELSSLYEKLTQYLVKNHQKLYTVQDSIK